MVKFKFWQPKIIKSIAASVVVTVVAATVDFAAVVIVLFVVCSC